MLLTPVRHSFHTRGVLQLIFKSENQDSGASGRSSPATLVDLGEGQDAVLDRLEVPDEVARRLMELGFLPGSTVTAARCAPGGDPRVFRIDGTEIALRRETAAHIHLRNGH